jgi:hypothetical protein
MRIYDGDFTVGRIKEDCAVQPDDTPGQHRRIVDGIDLDKLNERINQIPVAEIRRRRERMNVFYEEVLLTADPDRGIPFTAMLFLLTHYTVITDSRSLRLGEFLRRRARLQRVNETIRRNTVVGFFDTLHWSRKFKQAVRDRRESRMGAPLLISVPEIFIEDPDEQIEQGNSVEPRDFTAGTPAYTAKRASPNLPPINTSFVYPDNNSLRSAGEESPFSSPVRSDRLTSMDTSYAATGARRSSPTTPTLSPGHSPAHSRQGSAVSGIGGQGVMESFDASAWGESLRRSVTMRRPSRDTR